jgi:uncharacterized RDD family membrane protein YckC
MIPLSRTPQNAAPAAIERFSIETPEQTDVNFAIAGIGSRFLAILLDSLIQAVVLVLLVIVAILSFSRLQNTGASPMWLGAGLLLLWFTFYTGYYAIFEALWNGQTPGKRWVRIRVIGDTGRPITPSESVARNLMRLVDSLPSFYGIAVLSALISNQSKRLGDFLAGTIVVHERPLEDVRPIWRTPPPTANATLANRYPVQRLSDQDFSLIESFLARRFTLPPETRSSMNREIAARTAAKLSVPFQEIVGYEKFLEEVVNERRSGAQYR